MAQQRSARVPPGRDELQRRLARALRRRQAGRPSCLVCMEVAGAWDVRDAGGRAAGEALHEAVAETLLESLDEGVACVASSACEFALLLEGMRPERALAEARALKRAVDAMHFRWHGHPFRLEAFAGVLELGPHPEQPRFWLRGAREACTAARELGGSGVQLVKLNDHDWNDVARQREWVRHLTEIIG